MYNAQSNSLKLKVIISKVLQQYITRTYLPNDFTAFSTLNRFKLLLKLCINTYKENIDMKYIMHINDE